MDTKFNVRRLMLAGFAAAVAGSVHAAAPTMQIIDPWSRPAAAGTTGAGFMTLVNHGAVADTLTAVEIPLARRVEIHRSSTTGGMASMQRQAEVTVPAGQSVRFEPGGLHLMLIGLAKPLRTGDTVPATLVFAGGARIRTALVVGITPPRTTSGGRHH